MATAWHKFRQRVFFRNLVGEAFIGLLLILPYLLVSHV